MAFMAENLTKDFVSENPYILDHYKQSLLRYLKPSSQLQAMENSASLTLTRNPTEYVNVFGIAYRYLRYLQVRKRIKATSVQQYGRLASQEIPSGELHIRADRERRARFDGPRGRGPRRPRLRGVPGQGDVRARSGHARDPLARRGDVGVGARARSALRRRRRGLRVGRRANLRRGRRVRGLLRRECECECGGGGRVSGEMRRGEARPRPPLSRPAADTDA